MIIFAMFFINNFENFCYYQLILILNFSKNDINIKSELENYMLEIKVKYKATYKHN